MSSGSSCEAVERNPDIVSGAWVFRNTRIPVSALFENLEDSAQISDFIAWLPGVTTQQVQQVLRHSNQPKTSL